MVDLLLATLGVSLGSYAICFGLAMLRAERENGAVVALLGVVALVVGVGVIAEIGRSCH